jgi:conjugal transfer pilus assembly protein TraF
MFRLMLLLLTISIGLHAGFYDRYMEGRYWYDEKQTEDAFEDESEVVTKENAQEQLSLLQEKYKTAIALALLNPSHSNVKQYMLVQQKIMNLSDEFSNTWQKVLLSEASLNGELDSPTAQFALDATKAMEYEKIEDCLKRHKAEWILIFVYDSTQKYSQLAGEMLESFQADTGWDIVPVTLDGNDLPQWPNSKLTKDQGATLGVEASPAYILVNKTTEEIKHAGYGAIAVSRLKQNIYMQLGANL